MIILHITYRHIDARAGHPRDRPPAADGRSAVYSTCAHYIRRKS